MSGDVGYTLGHMPWRTTTPMEEAIRFTVLAKSGRFTVTELCEQFGISRKTAYKHIERYNAGGAKALAPRSSRPHRSPSRTDEEADPKGSVVRC